MKYSSRVEGLQGRRTSAWEIHRVAQQAAANGEDVIVLSVGDPDFATPAPIVERAIEALRGGDTHYSAVSGRDPLRAAIAAEQSRMSGCSVTAANVILTAGAQNGVFAASLCLLEAGDEVIVPEPMYLTYEACVRAAGATLVPVPVDPARAFHLNCDALENAVTSRTKAIFFATPCNPTGVVMPRADLERIARLACKHDLWVLSDEVYADLTFEREHVSIMALPGMAGRTVTLGSLSKSHAMAGWRVGWAIGPTQLIEHMGRLALAMLYGLPGFIQQAALTALHDKARIVAEMREIYRRRRDVVFEHLSRIPRLRCLLPEAGMFMMVDVSGTGLDTVDFTWRLFRAQGVSVLDASAFGETANGFVRLGFVVDEARLAEACKRIAAFVATL
ncbi:aminotransferase class I/II-fold pyridoxal phosphate-dependent enzyme [bacterium M00.F.Ca.ET.228.01.1.1]|uniref:pyridoxal phosphate-dependent aminotransferase n=1 Tax=Paraburkholderia phenoliruptrix TaxID=252970 RepID=UPI0010924EC7|nr:aminotransferase class I/II-fold pyridoxal phosphate-dependent enzyme [Paraburkholderia phenoliruptrix]TGP46184.1 aminotransferase class I/II-fold pyridoxal phosphate-dependent enzyme [bacterium M00.F.Ca.ET.228.01.1.1]TGS03903.1 aminotransferase class I/II-fold pyridoxal phosphate-dependent enzyme [bacterium M00.F.Ca.ET.191.01.1.1]TGU07477.1 aminotransferase class I/II-fold pyridoxal phosphate-dependent enzyme [bacterium M00.F.Ca.ET.155.01.1.1]MBW0446414.1 aminotransferase class I/II-fold py